MADEKKKKGRKRNYDAYVRDYNAKSRTLAANSVQMKQRMYTKEEFNTEYERLLNERKEEIKEGERKTTGNITRDLIEKQAFTLTAKQAAAMSSEKIKSQYNYYQRRQGFGQKEIDERYKELKRDLDKMNPTWSEAKINKYARAAISTEFFGS